MEKIWCPSLINIISILFCNSSLLIIYLPVFFWKESTWSISFWKKSTIFWYHTLITVLWSKKGIYKINQWESTAKFSHSVKVQLKRLQLCCVSFLYSIRPHWSSPGCSPGCSPGNTRALSARSDKIIIKYQYWESRARQCGITHPKAVCSLQWCAPARSTCLNILPRASGKTGAVNPLAYTD